MKEELTKEVWFRGGEKRGERDLGVKGYGYGQELTNSGRGEKGKGRDSVSDNGVREKGR